MSWTPDGRDTGNTVSFARFRCRVCGRTMVTCGTAPDRPCICTTRPQPKHRNMSGLKGRK